MLNGISKKSVVFERIKNINLSFTYNITRYLLTNMKEKILTITLFLAMVLLRQMLFAQTPAYSIKAKVGGLKDTTCILAHYFGFNQYIPKDTARADANGNMLFEGNKKLPEGLYLMVLPDKKRWVELLITDQQRFSFETDTADFVGRMLVDGSVENKSFYDYQKFMKTQYTEANIIQAQKKIRDDDASKALFNRQLNDIQQKTRDFRAQFLKQNDKTFTAKLLRAAAEPEVPPTPKLANGRPDSLFPFNYYKAHYWDGFDFADERLVRTPFLQRKLDAYIKDLTVQNADSIIKSADYVVGKAIAGGNKEIKSYTIWYITNKYEVPEVIGTDAVFVHMSEKYYLSGIMPIVDSSTIAKIRTKVNTIKPLLVGKVFPDMKAQDTLGVFRTVSSIKSDFTVVFFYDPTCGHCRDATPELKKFYDANRTKGVQLYAVAVSNTPEQWKKYIGEFKVGNWLHVYGPSGGVDYQTKYDVYTTPVVYVLDKDKKIIGKRLGVEQLGDFLNFYQTRVLKQKATIINTATTKPTNKTSK